MSLVQEFYGPEFALFASEKKSLLQIITDSPEKKPQILANIYNCLTSILSKAGVTMGSVSLFHKVLLDFFTLSPEKGMIEEIVELLKEQLVSILHTREGAHVAQLCILHASPKTRKVILKSFKTFVKKIAIEQYGYSVLLTCFESIDDTVLVGKCIISELVSTVQPNEPVFSEGIENFSDLVMHKYGIMTFLFLLCGRKCVPGYLRQELADLDTLKQLNGKKDDLLRTNELITIISPFLIRVVEENLVVLLKNKFSSQLVYEVIDKCIGKSSITILLILKVIKAES